MFAFMLLRLRPALAALALFVSCGALAAQAGFRTLVVPPSVTTAAPIQVALFYPTDAPERTVPMGYFNLHAARGAEPAAQVKGLVLLSHGYGGSEFGHASLAEALARDGWLVAALRHPGDNWADGSLLGKGAAAYLGERPRQASRVIDALLADPGWKDHIARDAKGPRVVAVGHSAGGYTVLALAGGRPDTARIAVHCKTHGRDDPVFCGVAAHGMPAAAPSAHAAEAIQRLADPRVRAVAALAPLGVVFTPESLAGIRLPTVVYAGERDTFLVPRFHAGWIAANLRGNDTLRRIPNASHWAFMDTPTAAIATPDGDIRDDPPGFDRAAFLKRLDREVPAFFDSVFRER